MAFSFDASVGFTYEQDLGSTFDGPEHLFAQPLGLGSLEAFGVAEFTLHIKAPPSILSAEAFGATEVQATSIVTDVGAIVSAEAFGTPEFAFNLASVGIASEEAFGVLTLIVQWEDDIAASSLWTPDAPLGAASWAPESIGASSWSPASPGTSNWTPQIPQGDSPWA